MHVLVMSLETKSTLVFASGRLRVLQMGVGAFLAEICRGLFW